MRLMSRFVAAPVELAFLAAVAAGCAGGNPPAGGSSAGQGTGGKPAAQANGGSTAGGSTGSGSGGSSGSAAGGSTGSGGNSAASGGAGGTTSDSGPGTMPDGGGTAADATAGTTPEASTGTPRDASSFADAGATPMGTDGGGPQPSYEGAIPLYYGPEVGPKVEMNCPGDPTEGWTEYQDAFNVQRPHNLPINTRFSIIGGVYNFWVFPNDAPHSPDAKGRNPRTEARYGWLADAATNRDFQTGQRMYSADMLIERNAVNSAIMQIHTRAEGGGPIGLRIHANSDMVNNGSLTVVKGDSVPGGLIDKWFNFKASFDASTLEVKIYINNCHKSTYKGPRGDGNFYFKNGVYFCKTSRNGCFAHFKNIHLYKK
jgi:hypothetical protein